MDDSNVVENFLENVEKAEKQADAQRKMLYQIEEEIKRVEEGTLELQQKAVDLDKEKERKLVDLSHKKAQSEFLTNKENMLKALIAEANTTLKKEKDNLAQQQDNIFLKRGKFCNTVREFVEEHGIVATLKKLQLKKQEADKTRSATEDVDDLYDIDENNEEDIELTEMKREVDTLETDLKEVTMQLEIREERQKAANKEREQLLKETTEGEEFVSGGMIQDHTLTIDWIADNVAGSGDKSVSLPARLQEKLLQLREDKKLLNQQCAALDKQQQQQTAQTQIISKPSSLPASSSSNEGLKLPPATMNISHSRNFTVKQNNNDKHFSNFLPRTQTNAPVLASRKHVSFYCYQEIEEGRDLQFVHKDDEKSFRRHSVDTQVLEASDEDLQETKVTLQRNCSSHDHEESDAGVFRENIKATNYSPLKDYYTDAQDQSNQMMKRINSHGDNVMPSFKRNTSFYCYEDAQLDEQSNNSVVPFKRNRFENSQERTFEMGGGRHFSYFNRETQKSGGSTVSLANPTGIYDDAQGFNRVPINYKNTYDDPCEHNLVTTNDENPWDDRKMSALVPVSKKTYDYHRKYSPSLTNIEEYNPLRYPHVNQSEDGVRIQGTSARLPLLPENSKNRLNLVESFTAKNNLDIYSQPYKLIPTLEKKTSTVAQSCSTVYENLEESQSFGSNKGQQPNSTIVTAPKSSKKLNKRVRGKRGGLSKCFVPKVPSKILSKIKIREEHKAQLEQDISNIVRQANKLHH